MENKHTNDSQFHTHQSIKTWKLEKIAVPLRKTSVQKNMSCKIHRALLCYYACSQFSHKLLQVYMYAWNFYVLYEEIPFNIKIVFPQIHTRKNNKYKHLFTSIYQGVYLTSKLLLDRKEPGTMQECSPRPAPSLNNNPINLKEWVSSQNL